MLLGCLGSSRTNQKYFGQHPSYLPSKSFRYPLGLTVGSFSLLSLLILLQQVFNQICGCNDAY
jgi:hypothetical protein